MRYFFDTEFIEYPCTIDLISIGMVSEFGGREFYAESNEVDWSKAHPWVLENVQPHLTGPQMSRQEIAEQLNSFIIGQPEFWAYYSDYDWVVFCWLWGGMPELPRRFPHMCLDLQQLARSKRVGYLPDHVPQTGTQHNALEDARWNLDAFKFLEAVQ